MMRPGPCPSHPRRGTTEDCPVCDMLIEQREMLEQEPDPGESDREANSYEKWLDSCGP